MAKVFGISKVRLNGVDYGTKTATCEPGGVRKTSQYASGKRTGSSQEPMGSRIVVTYEITAITDIEALRKFTGDVEYETDVGITYAIANAETIEPPRMSPGGAGIEVTIEGDPAVPI